MTGPRSAIEGGFGFARVFAGHQNLARVTERLGSSFEIENISIKLYPCCRMFHSLIEAIGECRADSAFTPSDIAVIVPFGPKNMINQHMERRPSSAMSAQYSLPYTAAVALVRDPTDPASFEQPNFDAADIQAMADLVHPVEDAEMEAMFPRHFAAGVRLKLRNGDEVSRSVLDSRSTPANPISRDDIVAKFEGLTASLLPANTRAELIDIVFRLDRISDVRDLTRLLHSLHDCRVGTPAHAAPVQ